MKPSWSTIAMGSSKFMRLGNFYVRHMLNRAIGVFIVVATGFCDWTLSCSGQCSAVRGKRLKKSRSVFHR